MQWLFNVCVVSRLQRHGLIPKFRHKNLEKMAEIGRNDNMSRASRQPTTTRYRFFDEFSEDRLEYRQSHLGRV